jgi:hypothetical protein
MHLKANEKSLSRGVNVMILKIFLLKRIGEKNAVFDSKH